MSAKSVAVVTGANKGLGQATARRQSFFERRHLRTISPWKAASGNQPLWKAAGSFANLTGLSRVPRSDVDDRRFGASVRMDAGEIKVV